MQKTLLSNCLLDREAYERPLISNGAQKKNYPEIVPLESAQSETQDAADLRQRENLGRRLART